MAYIVLVDGTVSEFVCRPRAGKRHIAPKHGFAVCGDMVTWYDDCIHLSNHSMQEETVCRRCLPIARKRGLVKEG